MFNTYGQVYGLTGIMGSGKSTAAKLFRELGAVVLDADQIARDVIEPGAAEYQDLRHKLEALFSTFSQAALFDAAGKLNRRALAEATFGDRDRAHMLGTVMHPAIQREFARRVALVPEGKVVIYDVPLLFEGDLDKKVRSSILVYAPEPVCIARAVARAEAKGERLSVDEARARLARQISIEKKRNLADHILDNSGDPTQLKEQVGRLYPRLEPK